VNLLSQRSLAETLDRVNEMLFFERRIPQAEARRVARWIGGRQGLPDSYADMFAPTERDFRVGIRLFTGERINTGAATGHILGEEACRTLIQLDAGVPEVTRSLARADRSMDARLAASEKHQGRRGFF
jgi:hypothetical protein